MTFILGFLAWYLAIGFLVGAWSLRFDKTMWDSWDNHKAMWRYALSMLVVSMIAWFPLTLLIIEFWWNDRKAQRSDRL